MTSKAEIPQPEGETQVDPFQAKITEYNKGLYTRKFDAGERREAFFEVQMVGFETKMPTPLMLDRLSSLATQTAMVAREAEGEGSATAKDFERVADGYRALYENHFAPLVQRLEISAMANSPRHYPQPRSMTKPKGQ